MNDKKTTIEELKKIVGEFRKERGWGNERIKDSAISLVLESVEMLELFQWVSSEEVRENEEFKKALVDEMSDVLWWVLVISDSLEVDVVESFLSKHKKRGEKYPLSKFSKEISSDERKKEYYKLKARTRGGHPLAKDEDND